MDAALIVGIIGTWKFLHIACMFGAFALAVGGGFVSHYVIRTGDIPAIRRVLPAWDRLGNLIGIPMFFLGIGFGFVTAVTTGFDLLAPWLVIAYVLVVAILVNGLAVYDPQVKRLIAAAAASPDKEPSPELRALIRSPRTKLAFGSEVALWVAIIFTMVVKPFS